MKKTILVTATLAVEGDNLDGNFFKKLLKVPRLSAVVSTFTDGGCAGAAGVGINPPKGPFAMLNLQKKLL